MRKGLVFLLVLAVIAAPQPASAWGFEAHRYIMARAIPLLPAEIRPFFERYQGTIVEHAIDPDLWRTAGWEQEPPRHFLDMDAYGAYPFPDLPRDYEEAVRRRGRDFVEKNGLLPWRSAEIHAKLVEAFTQKARYSRDNIKFFSSVLSHYISDAHVPFHAVVNYDGQLTGQRGIHARFESELFERFRSKLQVTPRPAGRTGPIRDFVFATLLESFPLAQQVLDADRAAVSGRDVYDQQYFVRLLERVQPILERRLADSISGSAAGITEAWIAAGRLPLPVQQAPAAPGKVGR